MPIDSEKRFWLVANVRLFHERKCAQRLEQMNIKTYLPIISELHYWKDRKKKIDRVLTPQMLFVYVNEDERRVVLEDRAVCKFYSFPGSKMATIIPDTQMKKFMFFVGGAGDDIEFVNDVLIEGDRVRVLRGPLSGLEGEYIRVGVQTKVAVRLKGLGCALVEIPKAWIEKIDL